MYKCLITTFVIFIFGIMLSLGITAQAEETAYEYDEEGQLVQVQTVAGKIQYEYDKTGNRTQEQVTVDHESK